MIRLIASDLDGTLLADHNAIHPRNLEALRRVMERGVLFAAVSGRSAGSISILLEDNGLMDCSVIAVNGCHVVDRPFGRTLALHSMPEGAAKVALDIFAAHGLQGCLYTEYAMIYTNMLAMDDQEGMHAAQAFADRMKARANTTVTSGPEAIEAALREPALKVFAICRPGEEAAFEAARAACAAIPGTALTSSWRDNFEVMPAGVDKGTALAELASRLGVAREEVLAFGDSENDLPMLTWAGHAYAMGNARTVVKQAVPNCTGRCDEGGVAQVVEQLVG